MDASHAVTAMQEPAGRAPRGAVLLVDDEEACLVELGRALAAAGHRVLLARSAAAALDLLERAPVDAVVAAVELKGDGGLRLLDRVRARWPEVVRIALAGRPDVASAVSAINVEEVFRYLAKPVSPEALCAALRCARARREAEGARVVAHPRSTWSVLTEEERRALQAAIQGRWTGPPARCRASHGGA